MYLSNLFYVGRVRLCKKKVGSAYLRGLAKCVHWATGKHNNCVADDDAAHDHVQRPTINELVQGHLGVTTRWNNLDNENANRVKRQNCRTKLGPQLTAVSPSIWQHLNCSASALQSYIMNISSANKWEKQERWKISHSVAFICIILSRCSLRNSLNPPMSTCVVFGMALYKEL